MIRPATCAPDAIVAVIRFDKTVGPILLWSTLSEHHANNVIDDKKKEKDSVQLDIALLEVLPMFVLPEGASSRRDRGTASPRRNTAFQLEITNESRFLLPIGSDHEVLFGCSVYVVVAENGDEGGRGASQFAVALLTKAPAMELLIDRLRSVASVFVRAQYDESGVHLERGLSEDAIDVLESLHASISPKQLLSGIQDFGALVPCVKLIGQRVREHCWSLLRLVLLEGRVLLYSRSQSVVSQACWSLASLLPGTVTAGLGFDSPAIAVPLFRWKRHGLPFLVFSNNSLLAPLVPMFDAQRVFSHQGFLAGTCNKMIISMPIVQADVVFDLDYGILTRAPSPPQPWTEQQKLQQRRISAVLDSTGGGTGYFFQQLLSALDEHHPQFKLKAQEQLGKAAQEGLVKWTQMSTNSASTLLSQTLKGDASKTTDSHVEPLDECGAVSSSCWEGSEGWVHAEIQNHLESVLQATEVGIEAEMVAMISNAPALGEGVTGDASTDVTAPSTSSSTWGGSWIKRMEEAALDVANRADALANERGWHSSSIGSAAKLLRQKSSTTNGGLIATLAPSFGPDFVNEWVNTNNHKVWLGQQKTRIEMKLNAKSPTYQRVDETQAIGSEEDRPVVYDIPENVNGTNLNGSDYLVAMIGSAASSLLFTQKDTASDCPTSGTHSFTYPNGDRYTGEWLNGQRHGRGVCVYAITGDKHEGEWVMDMPHGEGSFTTGTGDYIYDGEWRMGRQTGKGRAVWHARRESYSGDFEDGDFHGTGVHCGHDGDVYQGEFYKGRRNGVGTLQRDQEKLIDEEGTLDSREMKSKVNAVWTRRGVIEGGGYKVFKLCSLSTLIVVKYTGEWCDGMREGVGTCSYADGSTYTGSWRFDQPFGEGDFKNGDKTYHFVGEWQHGLRHGEGREEINVKEQFSSTKLMKFSREGRWERDDPVAGDWSLNWRSVSLVPSLEDNGAAASEHNNSNTVIVSSQTSFDKDETWYGEGDRSYVGVACEEGLAEGIGTMKYKETGAVYSGEWLRGQRHGQGVCVYADGSYHKGQWRDDAPVDRSLMFEDVSLNEDSWKSPDTTSSWPLGDDSKTKTSPLPLTSDTLETGQPQLVKSLSSASSETLSTLERIQTFTSSRSISTCEVTTVTTQNYIHYFDKVEDARYSYRQVSPNGLQELFGDWVNVEKVKRKKLVEVDSGVFGDVTMEVDDEDLDANSIYHKYQLSTNQVGVSGQGRGVDALAGIVYEGEWLLGLPHGEGTVTKTKPAARISATLSAIDLSQTSDENKTNITVEWIYKGEFKFGKISGVGIFERMNVALKDSTASSTYVMPNASRVDPPVASSSAVAAALAATSSGLSSSYVNEDNKLSLLLSLVPEEDVKSVPWSRGVRMVDGEHHNHSVYEVIWKAMHISISNTKWYKYSGEFNNGEISGMGTASFIDGSEYSGQWKRKSDRSISIGKGDTTGANHSENVGSRELGIASLHRIMIGEGLSSLPDGEGIWTSAQGKGVYSGPWSFGVPHGVGEFVFTYQCSSIGKDGSEEVSLGPRREEREGKWVKGIPADGDWRFCFSEDPLTQSKDSTQTVRGQYVGNIKAGFPHGEGICKYPSGSIYSGTWCEGVRQGKGSCVWNDGTVEYKGMWLNDEVDPNGQGELRLPDGSLHTFNS